MADKYGGANKHIFTTFHCLYIAWQISDFPLKTWRTRRQISDFYDTLGLNELYTALVPYSLRPAEGYTILVVCLCISGM
jgi:hypothetical protein